MASPTRIALAALALATSAHAQFVELSANPVAQGTQCTFTVTDTTGNGFMLPSPCTWFDIRQGTQTGPLVALNAFCGQIIVNVPGNGSVSFSWDTIDGNTGQPVAPGRYWIHTRIFDSTFSITRDWFCIDVVASLPADATLVQTGTARVGQPVSFQVAAPPYPGGLYATLFSFSQNNPLVLPGVVDLCISGSLLQLQSGALDSSGNSAPLNFMIPGDPSLAFSGFHLQSLVVDNALTLIDTNALPVLIRP